MNPIVEALFKEAKRQRLTMVAWAAKSNVDRRTLYSIKHLSKNAGLTTIAKLGAGLNLKLQWIENAPSRD